jgi:hypothetical protein
MNDFTKYNLEQDEEALKLEEMALKLFSKKHPFNKLSISATNPLFQSIAEKFVVSYVLVYNWVVKHWSHNTSRGNPLAIEELNRLQKMLKNLEEANELLEERVDILSKQVKQFQKK